MLRLIVASTIEATLVHNDNIRSAEDSTKRLNVEVHQHSTLPPHRSYLRGSDSSSQQPVMARTTAMRDPADVQKKNNLGSFQLRHVDSNQIILIPTPTNDPNGKHGSFLAVTLKLGY